MAVAEKEQFIQRRKGGIGGTDISAIVGLNPWRNAIDVWLAKLGREERPQQSEEMWWGNYFEAGIAKKYVERTGYTLLAGERIAQSWTASPARAWNGMTIIEHATHPFLIASPDALALHADLGVEFKLASWKGREWGKEGTDKVPDHYAIQCAWYMAITGYAAWDLAVLFNGTHLEIFTIWRNPELERVLIDSAIEFWQKHVVAGVPPPVDGSLTWARYLAQLYGKCNERVIPSTPEADRIATLLRDAKIRMQQAESDMQLAKNQLAALIGENKGMQGGWGKATWVRPQPGSETDWEALARQLLQQYAPDEARARILEFTRERPKTPYLKVTFAEREENP
jgi:putative phage-type endonuclease